MEVAMGSFWRRRSTVVLPIVAFVPGGIGWSIYQTLDLDRSTALGEALYLSAWRCSLAGFIAWYVEGGAPAVRKLARRCVRFRVPLRWWLVVLALPLFPDVDVRGLAFNYVRLGIFALTAALLVIATGTRSFLARPATAEGLSQRYNPASSQPQQQLLQQQHPSPPRAPGAASQPAEPGVP
jgi:hypothetical protein